MKLVTLLKGINDINTNLNLISIGHLSLYKYLGAIN